MSRIRGSLFQAAGENGVLLAMLYDDLDTSTCLSYSSEFKAHAESVMFLLCPLSIIQERVRRFRFHRGRRL